MNRLTFTIMLQKLIELYLGDGFNFEDFAAIVDNANYVEFNEEELVILETEIIYSLFQNIPYYKIENELRNFIILLSDIIKKTDNYHRMSRMIKSIFEDLIPTIKRIVRTFAKENTLKLIHTSYVLDDLTSDTIIQSLTENISDPYIITGLYAARNNFYEQYNFFNIEKESVTLRDKVSKVRMSKSDAITKELRRDTLKYYREQDFEEFITKVKEAIEASSLAEKKELKTLIYDEILIKLYISSAPKWNETTDNNQLKLEL